MIDLAAARDFMATHARLLDRRHLDVVLGGGAPAAVALTATLVGYRNPDGGFGWALEPDLRAESSQPVGALHALELLESALAAGLPPDRASGGTPVPAEIGRALCDWLDRVTLADGGLPFSIAGAASPGTAPWWAGADPTVSSLHITAGIASAAHRLADLDPGVAAHPWLERVTAYCLGEIGQMRERGPAYQLRYVLWLLDAAQARVPAAAAELERIAAFVPADAELPVEGGVEGERLRALDISPLPGRPLRALAPADAVARHLDDLEREQREDGGWTVDFPSASPAGAIEWRGIATVRALALLRAHGRL
ncbi:hypothetical protein [Conexibacter arvalis]|uniref:Prenyltransferase and squalene oxidase repeat-containing protein n=1 Tax=Conexibacter arvalis TaxID=912552 RepID=A0A840I8D2_9ACTN|nr:hypothetical protein [Conexibacter arvalis]MBB4660782.1 hypothetical protein [Conexibacter arvalis]